MGALQVDISLKTYSLTFDEPHFSCYRNGIDVSFNQGDQIIIQQTSSPKPGSLILVELLDQVRLCRYEVIHGNEYIFPPLDVDPSKYQEIILGQVIDSVRLKNWLSF